MDTRNSYAVSQPFSSVDPVCPSHEVGQRWLSIIREYQRGVYPIPAATRDHTIAYFQSFQKHVDQLADIIERSPPAEATRLREELRQDIAVWDQLWAEVQLLP